MSVSDLDSILSKKPHLDERLSNIVKKYYDNASNYCHDKRFYDCLNEMNSVSVYTKEELKLIVEEFNKHDLLIFAHAYEEKDVEDAVDAGIIRIEHAGDYSDELIQKLIEKKVIVTTTYVAAEDGFVLPDGLSDVSTGCTVDVIRAWYYNIRESIPRMYEKGVKIALGTDAGFLGTPFCSLAREMISLVYDLKIPVEKVLKSATVVGAEKLKMNYDNKRVGELAPKSYADFVLYENNFIENPMVLLQPAQVWIRGEMVYEKNYD